MGRNITIEGDVRSRKKESARRWNAKNPDYQKKWDAANVEYCRQRDKKYREENKDRIAKYKSEWFKTEKGKASMQRVRTMRRKQEGEIINSLTSTEWQDILEDYRYKCAYCGKEFGVTNKPTRDHVIPISRGGDNSKENIKPACRSCNSKKNTQLVEEIISKCKAIGNK